MRMPYLLQSKEKRDQERREIREYLEREAYRGGHLGYFQNKIFLARARVNTHYNPRVLKRMAERAIRQESNLINDIVRNL